MKNGPEIIYEDEDVVVLNKPAGMLSVPDRNDAALVSVRTWGMANFETFLIVHRLDRDTSGILIAAKNPPAHTVLNDQFATRQVEKTYVALLFGTPVADGLHMEEPIRFTGQGTKMMVDPRGKYASTHLRILKRYRGYTWVELRPETGRTHQLRVHLEHLGYPIVADEIYGDGKGLYLSSIKRKFQLGKNAEERPLLQRLALHAASLKIPHPASGEMMHFLAELPKDLKASLSQLDKWAS